MIAFSTPSMFHGAISSSFEGERPRCLWRIDRLRGDQYLLILSESEPDLSHIIDEYGVDGTGETLSYDGMLNRLVTRSTWRFRLCANPTYSVSSRKGERGRLCAHSTVDNQRKWLINQSEKHGFQVTDDSFDVTSSRWYRFGKGKNKVSLLSVTYEGILSITDEKLFADVMKNGIGRGKAYGMGMMTLVRPDR